MKKLSGTELRRLHMERLRKRRIARENGRRNGKGNRSVVLSQSQIATVRRYFHVFTWNRCQKRIAFELMLNLGLRCGELRVLRYGSLFDLKGVVRGDVEVRGEKARGGRFRFRRIPISVGLSGFLSSFVWVDGVGANGYIFPRVKAGGEPRSYHNFKVWVCSSFARVEKSEGWSGFSTHACRKSFIDKLYKSGVRIGVIAELAGHASLMSTMAYIEDTWSDKVDAVGKINFI